MVGLCYFAYGSNLHPSRLRMRAPGARTLGRAFLRGRQLRFHKRGRDGSGKCDAWKTNDPQDLVHGVIYRVSQADTRSLDRAEDAGKGYDRVRLGVSARGRCRAVFTYIARPAAIDTELRPFDWYLEYVLWGARYHRLPGRYVKQISRAAPRRDAAGARRRRHLGAILRCAPRARLR